MFFSKTSSPPIPSTLGPFLPNVTGTDAPSAREWSSMRVRIAQGYMFVIVAALIISGVLSLLFSDQLAFASYLFISFIVGTLAYAFVFASMYVINRSKYAGRKWLRGVVIFTSIVLGLLLGVAIGGTFLGIPLMALALNLRYHINVYLIITIILTVSTQTLFWIKIKMEQLRASMAQEKMRAEANARRAIEAQLQLLQAQIEPHMLFNTLANVQGLISFDPERASHMLDQLIVYLRSSLQAARAEKTTLAAEFALMDAYLGLMAVRMGKRLHFQLHLPVELEQLTIAPMLLQPLVENAIKHGLEPKIDGGSIVVSAQILGQCLRISVIDTGMGLDTPAQHGTQLGLSNICERLQALYGERASFLLRPNQPEGAISTLILPMSPLIE